MKQFLSQITNILLAAILVILCMIWHQMKNPGTFDVDVQNSTLDVDVQNRTIEVEIDDTKLPLPVKIVRD